MNKADLVEKVAHRTGMSLRDARVLIDAIFDPDPKIGLIAAELVAGSKVAMSAETRTPERSWRSRLPRRRRSKPASP
jgi:hypothetical protein